MSKGAHIAKLKNKSRSLEFYEDAEDNFFVQVLTKRGDQVQRTTTILKTDLPQWYAMFQRRGYEIVKNNEIQPYGI